jgi:hypothetical protein
MKPYFIFMLFAFGGWMGCKKANDTLTDDPSVLAPRVKVEIPTPLDGAVYAFGDTIHIEVLAEADFELHGYSVRMANLETHAIVVNQFAHAHDHVFHLTDYWVNDVSDTNRLFLQVEIVFAHTTDGRIVRNIELMCLPEE